MGKDCLIFKNSKMRYTVNYKIGWFWKSIKNVVADGYIDDKDVRYFVLEDKSIIEMGVSGVVFKFPPERDELVKKVDEKAS